MKTFTAKYFPTLAFGTQIRAALLLLSFPLSFAATFAQVTATEDFEAEGATWNGVYPASVNQFSAGGINFTLTGRLRAVGNMSTNYGANGSHFFVDCYLQNEPSGTIITGNVGSITINTSSTAFRVNSFAGYVASDRGGNSNTSGNIKFIGTKVGNTLDSAIINIPANPNVQNGISFAGTPLSGVYLTSLAVVLPSGIQYIELDDFNFTTQAVVSNQFSINDVSIVEGNSGTSNMSFTITRTNNSAAGSVQVQSSNGTATAGSDYTAYALSPINFTAGGVFTQTVNVVVQGDATIEPNETFTMTLSNPTGGIFLDATGIGTILDDDAVNEPFDDEVHNSLAFSQSGVSFQATGKLIVKNNGSFGAGGSSGYAASTEPFAAGNQGSFQVTTPGKIFTLISADLWSAVVTGTGPNWIYTATNCTITFTGTKADNTGTITHTAAITPTGVNGHFTVLFAGSPLANVALSAISFSTPAGIQYLQIDNFKYGTSTITNTQVSINDVSVLEGTGPGTTTAVFTVTRSNNTTAFSVNVASSNGTATQELDYSPVGATLNFTNGGAFTQTVSVPINRDALAEGKETFNMTLSNATNGTLYLKQIGVGSIVNDDGSIGETFEDETNNATGFTENTLSFSATGGYKVVGATGGSDGSGSSGFFLSSNANVVGSMGTIAVTTPNTAFRLVSLDAWAGTSTAAFSSGPVTFTGTLVTGGTVSTIKTITATTNTGTGWQQNVTFTGTPLENAVLSTLQITTGGILKALDIDNFNFSIVSTVPVIAVTDALNVPITNGGAATLTNNTNFGNISCVGGGTVTKVFTIKNTGYTNLTLSGAPLAVLGGTDATQFSVTAQPVTPIAGAASTTVTVRYNPTVVGTHNATLTLTNNDATNSPFIINLRGTSASTAGDPAIFGTDTWNVYAWNAGGAAIAGNTNSWVTNYSGYYTNSNLNVQTANQWNINTSPSSAANYQGCAVAVDNHSYSAKRQGFPCSYYTLSIPTHDDGTQLWINGTKVFEHDDCCDAHANVWTGFLGSNDRVEFRITEGGGGSEGQLLFTAIPTPAITTNNGLKFDGINDYVETRNCTTPIVNGGNAITVEYWFKGSSLQSAVRTQDTDDDYMVAGWNGKHILSNDGGVGGGVSVGAAATDGNWHHVAFSWQQGATNGFKSYLDGVLVEQKNAANNALPLINNFLYLGSFGGFAEFMNGTLDEVRVWNIVRTQAQIQAGMSNFCNQFSLPQTGLQVYFKFDHGAADGANAAINYLANAASTTQFTGQLQNFALTGATSNFTEGSIQSVEWIGNADGNWMNNANWACNQMPNQNSTVTIAAGRLNYPTINVSGSIYKLILNPGTTIRVASPNALLITGK
ncbi:MAG: LamG-like jellyroll fold domain-containing protein [Bacteroidota bacterium]